MIQPSETIIIERVGNGFILRPFQNEPRCVVRSTEDVLVFNEMGWASSPGNGEPCLLSFIEKHFRQPSPGGGCP